VHCFTGSRTGFYKPRGSPRKNHEKPNIPARERSERAVFPLSEAEVGGLRPPAGAELCGIPRAVNRTCAGGAEDGKSQYMTIVLKKRMFAPAVFVLLFLGRGLQWV
jgi:hypothetical protein